MMRALEDEAWNLATRRAQEALELMVKALLNEMSAWTTRRPFTTPARCSLRRSGLAASTSIRAFFD